MPGPVFASVSRFAALQVLRFAPVFHQVSSRRSCHLAMDTLSRDGRNVKHPGDRQGGCYLCVLHRSKVTAVTVGASPPRDSVGPVIDRGSSREQGLRRLLRRRPAVLRRAAPAVRLTDGAGRTSSYEPRAPAPVPDGWQRHRVGRLAGAPSGRHRTARPGLEDPRLRLSGQRRVGPRPGRGLLRRTAHRLQVRAEPVSAAHAQRQVRRPRRPAASSSPSTRPTTSSAASSRRSSTRCWPASPARTSSATSAGTTGPVHVRYGSFTRRHCYDDARRAAPRRSRTPRASWCPTRAARCSRYPTGSRSPDFLRPHLDARAATTVDDIAVHRRAGAALLQRRWCVRRPRQPHRREGGPQGGADRTPVWPRTAPTP